MAANSKTNQTKLNMNEKVKEMKEKCVQSYIDIANNYPIVSSRLASENLPDTSLCYMDAIRANVEATETELPTDMNLVTSQFLKELEEKVQQVDELISYKRGLILDRNNEILRIQNQIRIAEEANRSDKPAMLEVKAEHFQKAKHRFKVLKTELHGLVNSLFPSMADEMFEILAYIMQESLNEESSGYIEVTPEQYPIVEMLKDMGIVSTNPYDNKQVKLAY